MRYAVLNKDMLLIGEADSYSEAVALAARLAPASVLDRVTGKLDPARPKAAS
jgi:hypothetical protein